MATEIASYRDNCRIITMETDRVGEIDLVEPPLERGQGGVGPGCHAQTHLPDDRTNEELAEVVV